MTGKLLKLFVMVSICTSLLMGCSVFSSGAKDEVVIAYNSPPQWANWGAVLTSFNQETGIQAPSDNKNSGQTITALTAEKDSPVADTAYYGLVFGIQAANNDLVEGYKPTRFNDIPTELKDPDGKWMTIHYGAVAFIVNTDALGGAPIPHSWDDLLKPEYKGKIGFLDPTSAAIGYNVGVAANLAMGGTLDNMEPGIEYLKQLDKNDVIYPKQTATAKVLKGEIPILIDADFNGYKLKYEDKGPIEVVIPKEGSLKIPYVISLVKDAPHSKTGKKLIDFVLSDEGQKLFAEGFVRPIITSAMTPEIQEKFLPDSDYERVHDVDYREMAEKQEKFIELWQKNIVQQ